LPFRHAILTQNSRQTGAAWLHAASRAGPKTLQLVQSAKEGDPGGIHPRCCQNAHCQGKTRSSRLETIEGATDSFLVQRLLRLRPCSQTRCRGDQIRH
jgi:hypothetical protein